LLHAPGRQPRGGWLMVSGTGRRVFGGLVHALVLMAFSVLLAFPFYWMLITIFKTTNDLYDLRNNPFKFNEKPTLEHLQLLFHDTLYLRWVGNTAFVGAVVVLIRLLLAVLGVYALGRWTGG